MLGGSETWSWRLTAGSIVKHFSTWHENASSVHFWIQFGKCAHAAFLEKIGRANVAHFIFLCNVRGSINLGHTGGSIVEAI